MNDIFYYENNVEFIEWLVDYCDIIGSPINIDTYIEHVRLQINEYNKHKLYGYMIKLRDKRAKNFKAINSATPLPNWTTYSIKTSLIFLTNSVSRYLK